MTWAHQIQNLLDTREVVQEPSWPHVIIGHYHQASNLGQDAANVSVSIEGRVLVAYSALHHLADALTAMHGLKVKSGRSHHRNLFLVVRHLNIPGVGRLDEDAKEAADARTKSAYDIETNSEDELRHVLGLIARLDPIVLGELCARYPEEVRAAGLR